MDALYENQQAIFTKIAKAYENFYRKGEGKRTFGIASARLQGLESTYKEFCTNHKKIVGLNPDKEHLYFTSNLPISAEDCYYSNKGQFMDFLRELEIAERANANPQGVVQPQNQINVADSQQALLSQAMPSIDIPKFSGKYAEWRHFKKLFNALVNKQSMDSAYKMHYLMTHVTDEALEKIKHYEMDGDYEAAWEELNEYYENTRRLVDMQLSELISLKPIESESVSELRELYNCTFKTLGYLESLNRPVEKWDDVVVYLTVSRLDQNTLKDWQKHLGNSRVPPTQAQLKTFLSSQITTLESIENASKVQVSIGNKNFSKPAKSSSNMASLQAVASDSDKEKKKTKCALCKQEHYIASCPTFLEKTAHQRKKFITEKYLCYNCLGFHAVTKCESTFRCKHCRGKHHSLIHLDTEQSGGDVAVKEAAKDKTPLAANLATEGKEQGLSCSRSSVLLATALVKVVGPTGITVFARALIDQGSQPSFISESLCQRLKLKRQPIEMGISTVGSEVRAVAHGKTVFEIHPHFKSDFSCLVEALIFRKISDYKPATIADFSQWQHLQGLTLADPYLLEKQSVDILLGASVHAALIKGNVVKGNHNQPIATSTHLGWIISGDAGGPKEEAESTSLHISVEESDLSNTLQQFWRQEEITRSQTFLTTEEKECENYFLSTVARAPDNHYTVRLPVKESYKDTELNLGDTYNVALKVLLHMERKMEKETKFADDYRNFMDEYEQLGHMQQVDLPSDYSNWFFLPHHGILKESSTTTKLRIVFNGSAKSTSGYSLNDILHQGPNMLLELIDVLCRWRQYKYAFVADIEKMYRQIWVDPHDRHLQAILWRRQPNQRIKVFLLSTITYGENCSPYLALKTVDYHADKYKDLHPLGAQIIKKEKYMDDVASGGHTIEGAVYKQTDVMELLKVGGFPLRKWGSNESQLINWLPWTLRAENSRANLSVLGMKWQTNNDALLFEMEQKPLPEKLSKRVVLSKIAQFFDPLGLFAPVVITAKIVMQKLWLLGIGWDDELPSEIANSWRKWYQNLNTLAAVKIPRWNNYSPEASIVEIHGFADASSVAYGAVLYLRVVATRVTISLQASKTHVAPLKSRSTPELELCAVLDLANLVAWYVKTMEFNNCAIHLWSDSRDVLFWLRDHPARWKPFVANRCSKIQDLVPGAHWHHVKSKENPADLCSRGLSPEEMAQNELWWQGPPWLTENMDPWSTAIDPILINNPKGQKVIAHQVSLEKRRIDTSDNFTYNFSNWNKLLRIIALCIRFIYSFGSRLNTKLRNKINLFKLEFLNVTALKSYERGTTDTEVQRRNLTTDKRTPFQRPSNDEIENARLLVVYILQRRYFEKECQLLIKGMRMQTSKILKLRPVLEQGLLRVGGRLRHSSLAYEERHQLILPCDDKLVDLIVQDCHERVLHGGTQLTLTAIRSRYWIVLGRQRVKSIIHRCQPCLRFYAKPMEQVMGDLPAQRVTPGFPFEESGIDYAGPISLRLSRSRGRGTCKGYIAVFICLKTKAVHLEPVEDYSTESFIGAFKRFVSRRGYCSLLMSDQGTNFVGANSALQKLFDLEETQDKLLAMGVTWKFNPPSAPHMGGLREAAVKSCKHHLRRVIGEHILTFVELTTVLCEIEACLNSRPLVPLTDDPQDPQPLTPAHFLIQRPSFLVPEKNLVHDKIPIGKRWQLMTQMVQCFWHRWSTEYLSTLQERRRWYTQKESLEKGDLVLVRNEMTYPGQWPKGLIEETYPDDEGNVRVVLVKTAKSLYKRPIAKLVFLGRPCMK